MRRACLLGTLFLIALACGDDGSGSAHRERAAVDFDGEECAACGMIVREQPSPRAQLVHADGTRLYFCAIADMLTYLQAPSPHGAATAIHVEANDPAAGDPVAHDTGPRPWVAAASARFVVGIRRERVMGQPVLAYEDDGDAGRIARRLGGEVTDWEGLQHRAQTEHD